MHFITVQEAFDVLNKHVPSPQTISLPLLSAKGSFASVAMYAPIAVPPFDNSAMDGYAIRFDDWQNGKNITPVGTIKAGDTQKQLVSEGEAYKIFTGAPIPEGADTVVMKEWVSTDDVELKFLDKAVNKGDHIRLQGSQTQKNAVILNKGALINSGVISFLATFGITHIDVYAKPKVSIVITGDELVQPGKSLSFGQIYESNGITLTSLLNDLGIETGQPIIVKDTLEDTTKCISLALENSDIVLITGGISVGDFDFVQTSLENSGVQKLFYKILQKPGKPIYAGKKNNQMVFALPGNPAAVFSCFHTYVKPFILKFMNPEREFITFKKGMTANTYQKKPGLTNWVKAFHENGEIHFLQGQESYRMDSFAQANALVCLPADLEFCARGTSIDFIEI